MRTRGLVCPRRTQLGRSIRWNSSSKPFYVTTPIFYPNASPHLGHLYSMLLADTRVRWEKLDPKKSGYLLTGTDEHGLKIQAAAEKAGIEPKELVDKVSDNFKVLAKKYNVDYDRFMRTTDDDHIKAVQYFWDLMMSKGLILEGSHSGWYCVSDETFYPENQIEEIIDEKTGQKKMISIESRNEVVFQEEENYFFKLSQFQDELLSFLEKNPTFILPQHRYNQVVNILKEAPLPDLSISRPSSRLKWSIEVPNDPSQKIYVWFDALLNYLTAASFPHFERQGDKFITPVESPWPATHIIGKDIIKFHCIYWPIFLLAAGIELPKKVVVHAHWLSDGFKMSKSLGNVVDPFEILDHYGEDAVRFFLMENSNIQDDCKYREELLHQSRESLIGKYANLISRCGNKAFNIRESVEFSNDGKFAGIDSLIKDYGIDKEQSESIIAARNNLLASLDSLYANMDSKLDEFDHIRAIQDWWTTLYYGNQVFQIAEPWSYSKLLKDDSISVDEKEKYKHLQNYFVYLAAETSRISSILISPIIPTLSQKILDRLNVSPEHRNAGFAKVGADQEYGEGANGKHHKMPIEKVKMRERNVEAEEK
ncbi:mitochondrial methionyl-tRNA synthetase [Scheffersomyces xylosifermentans]|uniref:mitochondrial methionyl-tRNA synthetase n=1 Tax=Scheffersomyces xylosifermentans TaxID=1304137 RepID=UPI00315C5A24